MKDKTGSGCARDNGDRSSKKTITKKVTAKRHFWVPPPALTSPGKKVQLVKSLQRTTSTTKRETTSGARTEFIEQLEGLLDEIRQVKSSRYLEREVSNGDMKGSGTDRSAAAEPLTVGGRLSDRERLRIQQSLGLVKEELLKSVSESASLSDRHSLLVERLKRIEEDASDAVRHVASIRRFVKQLSQEEVPISPSQLEKRKDLLCKLARLDEANRSLQNLIGGISAIGEPQAVEPQTKENTDRFEKYESELKSLRDRMQVDRRETLNLKAELNEKTVHWNAENQSLKADISSHRERANKYLSDFDAVTSQLNEKNEELNRVKIELERQRLCSSRLHGEHVRTKFENRTLQSKLNALEDKLREDESSIRTKMNEVESNFHEMSSKATVLELENSKLKLTLAGSQSVVSKQRSEIERLEKEVENSMKSNKTEFPAKKNESIQVDLIRGNPFPDKAAGDQEFQVLDDRKWIKVTELYQFIEKEKTAILHQLKQLKT